MLIVQNMLHLLPHLPQDILREKTQIIIKDLQREKGYLFSSDPRGCFEFHISTYHIFGFAEYKKVIYGLKHTLTLTRGSDNQALYRNDAAVDGKVDITEYILVHATNSNDTGIPHWNEKSD